MKFDWWVNTEIRERVVELWNGEEGVKLLGLIDYS